jgi:hypothetical protein
MKDKYIKKEPFLFIYIPSYNRFSHLEWQLDQLTKQIDPFRSRVRVLVSNNNSQDGDYNALALKYKPYPIEFRNNPANIGGNANITLGFVFARENEFIWILSDDDRITSFALDTIFSALDNSIDVLHIGFYPESRKANLQLDNLFTITKGAGFGLISVGIFNMSFFRQYIFCGFDYLDSSFPHLAIIMAALRDENNAVMATARHDMVFTSEILDTHGTGDYAVSSVGFGYLADFLPIDHRHQFLSAWIKDGWVAFLNTELHYKNKYNRALGYLLITSPFIFIFLIFMRVAKKAQNFFKFFKSKLK